MMGRKIFHEILDTEGARAYINGMKLEDIGFYTLSDERAANSSHETPLHRCELIVTDYCNFRCPYCRGTTRKEKRHESWESAQVVLDQWIKDGLVNIRFSGGEPTIWPHLERAVKYAKTGGIKRIAISTNGSAAKDLYDRLLVAGVDDFSVSLDACCAATGDTMAGRGGMWAKVVENIGCLAARAYTTAGVVFTGYNAREIDGIVSLALSLGVADVRIIPAAQDGRGVNIKLPSGNTPILKYRINNLLAGRPFRGLRKTDCRVCFLALDDMAVYDGCHYPCIIYLREGGLPVGGVSDTMRRERWDWVHAHDSFADDICRHNCLDVCVDYNNRAMELRQTRGAATSGTPAPQCHDKRHYM